MAGSITEVPALGEGEVHVWRLAEPEQIELACEVLSVEETARVETYLFQRDARRFRACRATLRVLLGAYMSRDPVELAFSNGHYGKPELKGEAIHFNISHCDGMALFAFSRTYEVGVDVEGIRMLPDLYELMKSYASHEEFVAFQEMPQPGRLDAFFRWWTAREAHAKCMGEGLHALERSMNILAVLQSPYEGITMITEGRANRISFYNPAPGYAGALCIRATLGAPSPMLRASSSILLIDAAAHLAQ